MIGPVSYTLGHGDEDTRRPNAASDDVGVGLGLPNYLDGSDSAGWPAPGEIHGAD